MDYDLYYHNQISLINIESEYKIEQQENYIDKLTKILNLYEFDKSNGENIAQALNLVIPNQLKELEKIEDNTEFLIKLNDVLQKNFTRGKNVERQQTIDKTDNNHKNKLKYLFKSYIEQINDGKDLDHKIILGSTETNFRERINFLLDSIENGDNTKIIYPAGGERDLWLDHEPIVIDILAEQLVKLENIDIEQAKKFVIDKKNEFFSDVNIIIKNIEKSDINQLELQKQLDQEIKLAREKSIKYFKKEKGINKWPIETDMIKRVISEVQKSYNFPKNIEIKEVLNPSKREDTHRVDTKDNYLSFINKYGEKLKLNNVKSIAIVTSQPYAEYQLEQGRTVFWQKNFNVKIEPFAHGADIEKINYSDILDSISRTICAGLDRVIEKSQKLDHNTLKINHKFNI